MKKLSKKLIDQLDKIGQNDYNTHASELNDQCGMVVLSELDSLTPKQQAEALLDALTNSQSVESNFFDEEDYNLSERYSQVLISDTIYQRTRRWVATKNVAKKGPITVNPNTGNKIQLYIITLDMIPKIWKSRGKK